ncbi:MAG: LruC domain-containing protein [Bacteroidales bacterium]|nr:LruC domain-containing protein [Bacteroidales bacterium]
MTIKRILTACIIIILVLSGCENSAFFNPFKNGRSLNTVQVPANFSWTLATKVDLAIDLQLQNDSIESIEGHRIYLLDTNFQVLTRGVIHDDTTHLYYKIPTNTGQMIVYFPTTGNFEYIYSWACWGTLPFPYAWTDPDEETKLKYLELPEGASQDPGMKSGVKGMKASVFANSDFSDEALTETSTYTDNLNVDGSWYVSTRNKGPASIEEYQSNSALKFGQNSKKKVEVFQTISWTEGGEFSAQMKALSPDQDRIKIKIFLYFYSDDGKKLRTRNSSYNIKNPDGWQALEVSSDVPDNTSYIKLVIQDLGNKQTVWVDDVTSTYYADVDADNDGVNDDEDDYPNDPDRAYNDYYPSADGFGTLAFEDLWPATGDYDFNDLVLDYRYNQVRNSENKIIEILATINLRAIGGSFHNGFGFQLPFDQSLVAGVSGQEHKEGIVKIRGNGTESDIDKTCIIVFEDAWNYVRVPGVSFVNTRTDSEQADPYTFNIKISLTKALTDEDLGSPPYNPFIFTNGRRDHEIHLFGQEPTDLMDKSLFGTGNDYSNSANSRYFNTASNLPWALDIPTSFEYPEEKTSVDSAYLYFIEWAETAGSSRNDWYQDKDGYRDRKRIFKKK